MGPQVLWIPCVVRGNSLLVGCLLLLVVEVSNLLDLLTLVLRSVLLLHIQRADKTGVNRLAYQLDFVFLNVHARR